jgi:flagellar hook-basal body complex protein FliE
MSSFQVNAVLAQIRSMQAQISNVSQQAGGAAPAVGAGAVGQAPATSFAAVLKQGLDHVNQSQQSAADLATKFERGTPGIELPQVMLEMQKASVSFRALTEVRNKLVNAYQEIMNMPI